MPRGARRGPAPRSPRRRRRRRLFCAFVDAQSRRRAGPRPPPAPRSRWTTCGVLAAPGGDPAMACDLDAGCIGAVVSYVGDRVDLTRFDQALRRVRRRLRRALRAVRGGDVHHPPGDAGRDDRVRLRAGHRPGSSATSRRGRDRARARDRARVTCVRSKSRGSTTLGYFERAVSRKPLESGGPRIMSIRTQIRFSRNTRRLAVVEMNGSRASPRHRSEKIQISTSSTVHDSSFSLDRA